MHYMAPIYAQLISIGMLTMNDVPDIGNLRDDVLRLLEEYENN